MRRSGGRGGVLVNVYNNDAKDWDEKIRWGCSREWVMRRSGAAWGFIFYYFGKFGFSSNQQVSGGRTHHVDENDNLPTVSKNCGDLGVRVFPETCMLAAEWALCRSRPSF